MAQPDSTAVVALLAKRVAELQRSLAELARQPGPAGVDGIAGRDGKDGLDGKDGRDGKDGLDGTDGKDGRDGRDGTDGKDGAVGPAPKHEWRGTKLRFQQPDGSWGKLVDLQGPKGERGPTGYSAGGGFDPSGTGGAGFDPSGLPMAAAVPLPSEVIVQQGGAWVRATWTQMVDWMDQSLSNGERVMVNGERVTVNGERVTVASVTVNGESVKVGGATVFL